jgi:poly(beta-D-mannuronate) lyase
VVRDIRADHFYMDAAGSVPDRAILDANKASMAALDDSLIAIIRKSDAVLRGDPDAASCAGRWLAAWAQGGGMLGVMSSRQAGYERKWRTVGIAMAYLKAKPGIDSSDRALIEPWLQRLADAVISDYGRPRPDERNNHYYWAGLAAGAVGTATGSSRLVSYAREAYDLALAAIQPDGTLPQELRRKGRALVYHNYALAPLVMLAELAARRDEDWYGRRSGAIHRLAARTLDGIANPGAFATLAGEQSVEVPHGGILGWLAFYRARFPDRVAAAPNGPFIYHWLGGDLSLMASHWVRS